MALLRVRVYSAWLAHPQLSTRPLVRGTAAINDHTQATSPPFYTPKPRWFRFTMWVPIFCLAGEMVGDMCSAIKTLTPEKNEHMRQWLRPQHRLFEEPSAASKQGWLHFVGGTTTPSSVLFCKTVRLTADHPYIRPRSHPLRVPSFPHPAAAFRAPFQARCRPQPPFTTRKTGRRTSFSLFSVLLYFSSPAGTLSRSCPLYLSPLPPCTCPLTSLYIPGSFFVSSSARGAV